MNRKSEECDYAAADHVWCIDGVGMHAGLALGMMMSGRVNFISSLAGEALAHSY